MSSYRAALQEALSRCRGWGPRPRTWMFLGMTVMAAGLYLRQDWLAAVGVAPLFIAVLPCLAMCALGLCMHGRTNKQSPPSDNER